MLTIPNVDQATYQPQAAPDAGDYQAIVAGVGGTGVFSGLAVSAQGTPNMTVAVAAGVIDAAGVPVSVAAVGSLTIGTADGSNPRIDLIVVSSAGTVSVVAGTAAAFPEFAAYSSTSVLLAAVYVPAGATSIATAQIIDKRVLIGVPFAAATHGSTASYPRPAASRVYWEGSVAPTNASAGDLWRDTTLNATRTLVGTAWYYPPGFELGYQERTTNDTTSNTARASASSNTISGLTISGVVGTGQAVDIEFYCSAALTDVANSFAGADLVINGTAAAEQLAAQSSPATTSGRTLLLRRRKVLVAGTSYTFDVGKYAQSGVTTATYAAAAANPMYLSVTCR